MYALSWRTISNWLNFTHYRNKKEAEISDQLTLYILILEGLQQPGLCTYSHLKCYLIYMQLTVVIYNAVKPSHLAW